MFCMLFVFLSESDLKLNDGLKLVIGDLGLLLDSIFFRFV